MSGLPRSLLGRTAVLAGCVLLIGGLTTACAELLPATEEASVEPAPPADQTYIGAKECASCHFKQFLTWKKTKHAGTFNLLSAEYREDAKCLPCHTTGYGKPSGFKDIKSTPNLASNTCEMCHGPGSKHAEVCQAFAKQKLGEAEEKAARDSIWKMLSQNVCVTCHLTKAHKESATPKELRSKD